MIKHLKLVINNENKKDIFFNKIELQIILNLYAKMVSSTEWRDYGLSISKNEVSFNVYHRTSEFPAYKITKNFKPKTKNERYLIKDSKNKIIKNSENLKSLIENIIWKKFKLVN
jgi:hypothetical protein|tara:strand:- start:186 stop:527 length:342 start_codon:yes stop_codon:yes gene_type:complete